MLSSVLAFSANAAKRTIRRTAVKAVGASSFLLLSASAFAQVDANTLLYLPFNGSLNGAQGQTPTTSTNLSFAAGVSVAAGQAASFTGASDLRYASTDNLNPFEGTLEFFARTSWRSTPNQGYTFLTVASGGGLTFSKDGANNLRGIFNRYGENGSPEVGTPAVNVATLGWQDNEWHAFAYTWSNTNKQVQLYLDGTFIGANSFAANLPAINPSEALLWVGQDTDNADKLTGLLDELRVSNRVRTSQEIRTRYNSFVSAAAPEPASVAFFVSGLVMGAGLVRRRRRK